MDPIIVEYINNSIIVFTRKPSYELVKQVDTKFRPYFYVENPRGIYRTFDGKKATKIVVKKPSKFKELLTKFKEKGFETYEADISFTIRYSIDNYPAPWKKIPLRICYFDIEVEDCLDYINTPKPIVSITAYDNFDKKYYTFVLGKENKIYSIKDGYVLVFDKEESLLNKFLSFINKKDPDLLVAWNVEYDINYLINRMEKLGIDYNRLSRLNNVVKKDGKIIKVCGRAVIDLLKLYRKLKAKTLESYSLENVAIEEGLDIKKLPRMEMSKMDLWSLVAYNKRDVEIIVNLDKKLGIIDFWDELRRFIGLPWNDFVNFDFEISNKKIVDIYLLRLAKEKGIVLPTIKQHKRKPYQGALVLEPPVGVFKNVVVVDVKSMYPNIIRSYNLSPETLDPKGKIITPLGYRFRKDITGLIPEACSRLFSLRKQFKEEMKKYLKEGNEEKYKEFDNKQTAVKIILNSLYGVTAYKNFRLFKQEVAETVTAFGRELLKHIIRTIENQGYKVLYADTDSAFIKFPDDWTKEKCLEEANKLIDIINKSFNEFAKKWGIDKHYHEIELKFIFDRIAFFGVKKRYAGYYVNEEGEWKNGFEIKGLQIVRSDSAEITKEVLNNVLRMLLIENKTPKDALKYIQKVKEDIRHGKIPIEKLVFKQTFDANKKYKQKNTPVLRGLNLAKDLGIIDNYPTGKVVWIYVKYLSGDVLAVPEDKIDVLNNYSIDYLRCEFRWFGNIERLLTKLINKPIEIINNAKTGSIN